MGITYYIYILSTLSIVLGFFALLKQKTYIDAGTNQPTEVELPLVGKLKSNYPALVFVILGFGASIFAFNKSYDAGADSWYIHGIFYPDSTCLGRKVDYQHVQITLEPANVTGPGFDTPRSFVLEIKVPKGKSFEDQINAISFALDNGEATRIDTKAQFKRFQSGEKDMLYDIHPTGRYYNIPVKCYQ